MQCLQHCRSSDDSLASHLCDAFGSSIAPITLAWAPRHPHADPTQGVSYEQGSIRGGDVGRGSPDSFFVRTGGRVFITTTYALFFPSETEHGHLVLAVCFGAHSLPSGVRWVGRTAGAGGGDRGAPAAGGGAGAAPPGGRRPHHPAAHGVPTPPRHRSNRCSRTPTPNRTPTMAYVPLYFTG